MELASPVTGLTRPKKRLSGSRQSIRAVSLTARLMITRLSATRLGNEKSGDRYSSSSDAFNDKELTIRNEWQFEPKTFGHDVQVSELKFAISFLTVLFKLPLVCRLFGCALVHANENHRWPSLKSFTERYKFMRSPLNFFVRSSYKKVLRTKRALIARSFGPRRPYTVECAIRSLELFEAFSV